MSGNWLQRTLNWYWMTPWQLALFLAVLVMIWAVAMRRLYRERGL